MGKKVKTLVAKSPFSLLLALLFSGAFFVSGYRPELSGSVPLLRHLALSGGMFLLQFTAFYLFSASMHRHLVRERADLPDEGASGPLLWCFVFYKEVIKTVVGVSLTLGWLAGLLFIAEHSRDQFILVPVLLGGALSALAFLPALFFASLLDQIRYPQRG